MNISRDSFDTALSIRRSVETPLNLEISEVVVGKRLIQPVLDNKDKQKTYAENMAKYRKAMAGEFYFEAMLIDYAMLEDRLRSFLYHIALLKGRESYKADNTPVKDKIKPKMNINVELH